jgi:pimeloyl-ACP methyl ester carboxylesterase
MGLHVDVRGSGAAVLLLLHGMGATGAVWRQAADALEPHWRGRIVSCDLPGHGSSPASEEYTFDSVAEAVAHEIPPSSTLVVVGHSFGGVIALLLASGSYGVSPTAVVASSVKVTWSDDDLASAAAFAAKPARLFDSRAEAEERYRKVAGLGVEIAPDAQDVARGVVEQDGRFRLAQDPRVSAVGDPRMADALAAARCPVLLCRGSDDPMVSDVELAALGAQTAVIAGAGHNVHLEAPEAFARCILDVLDTAS